MALQLNVGSLTSGSGIDVQGTVDQLMSLQRAPLTQMQRQQAALQSQASALTNIQTKLESLQSAVQELGNFVGSLAARAVTSSQPAAISAMATSAAAISQHQISIDHIASGSSWYSKPFQSKQTFSAGDFQLQLGSSAPLSINVNQGDTLQTIATTINSQNAGVTANVITDATGSRLTVLSNNTGLANEITISGDTIGFEFQESASAKDASLTVDGVPIDSASNVMTTVIAGVTLTLNSATQGTAILSVQRDTSQAEQAITTFVDAYNSAIQAIGAQFHYDQMSKTSGPLAGDSTLRAIQQTVEQAVSFELEGNIRVSTLYDLGIRVQDDGTLLTDTQTLASALAENSDALQNFFQSTSPTGFASALNKTLTSILNATSGAITVDLKGIADTGTALQHQIDDMNDRLNTEEQGLLTQFEQVDALLRSFPTTMNQIDAILAALPSASKANSK
ncbi:MAG TPA: flagellar filament capping protein FliD [Terriglobales bacterium]|nr:flagellar filament capping protein FliD [Terriglobales bacterium]